MEARRRLMGRADQVSVLEAASNLRDLIRQDDRRGDALAGLTLAAVLGCEEIRAPTRTLLDIIKDEESGAAYRGLAIPQRQKSWKSFKDRLRLRRAGAAWSTSSSNPVSASDLAFEDCSIQISDPIPVPPAFRIPQLSDLIPAVSSSRESEPIRPIGNTQPTPITPIGPVVDSIDPVVDSSDAQNEIVELTDSQNAESVNIIAPPAPIRLAAALEAEREQQQRQREQEQRLVRAIQEQEAAANTVTISDVVEDIESPMAAEAAPAEPAAPMRMSLMALLEETDREAGVRYMIDEDEDEDGGGGDGIRDEDEQEVEEGESGGVEYVCCVCMVRHKGAAFIPCGHTFCRLCSRELWVSRGNCPLCNGYILEILDIF